MNWMILILVGLCIATKGQAKKVSSQRDKYLSRHIRPVFFLPRAYVVWANLLIIGCPKHDWGHVPTLFCNCQRNDIVL
jgi:hypothetical protein